MWKQIAGRTVCGGLRDSGCGDTKVFGARKRSRAYVDLLCTLWPLANAIGGDRSEEALTSENTIEEIGRGDGWRCPEALLVPSEP